jgi:hypothetical protein
VSSMYRILCLSHNPALELETPEWHSGDDGRVKAEHAAAHPEDLDGLAEHTACDLLVGRYSYPLVEVGCPAVIRDSGRPHPPGTYHPRSTEWVDIEWLRLLWLAQQAEEGPLLRAAATLSGWCWSPARLNRLANVLRGEAS